MKKLYILMIIFVSLIVNNQVYCMENAVVQGQIIAIQNRMPAPGLTVFLVHPNLGRSAPAITDSFGRFMFMGIPFMGNPYYIEVYWGRQLLYRSAIIVNSDNIILPTLML